MGGEAVGEEKGVLILEKGNFDETCTKTDVLGPLPSDIILHRNFKQALPLLQIV